MAFGSAIKAAAAYVQLYLKSGAFYQQWGQLQGWLKARTAAMNTFLAGGVKLGLNTKAFLNGLKQVTNAFTAAIARIRSAGRAVLFAGIISALPFAAALAELTKFDDKMRTVRAVSEATEAEFNQLTESAKRFAAETRASASDVADLMIELGRAGFVADDIDKMTLSILQLSRATGTDTVTAAVAAATAMRQFSLPVTDITRVVDGFTVTANASFASVESLTESFKYAGPVLAQLGYSLEESLAIIGTLANFGIKDSEAGTAVRRIATISVAKAGEIQKILGVAFVNADGNARKIYDVLNEINILTKDIGNAARAAKFEQAFGLLGITSATVISEHGGDIIEMLDKINNGAGANARALERMDAGIGGSFGRLLSKIKLVAIQSADTLSGAVIATESILNTYFKQFTEFINKNKEIIPAMAQAVLAFTLLGAAIFSAGVLLSPLASAMTILGGVFGTLGIAVSGVTGLIGFFSTALGLGGVPAAVIVIGGLVLAFNELKGAVVQAQYEWEATFNGLADLASVAVRGIKDAIVGGDLDLAWDILVNSAKFAWDAILARMKYQWKEFYFGILDELANLPFNRLIPVVQAEVKSRAEELDRLRQQIPAETRTPEESDRIAGLNAKIREQKAELDYLSRHAEEYSQLGGNTGQSREDAARKRIMQLELEKRGATEAELALPQRLEDVRKRWANTISGDQIRAMQIANLEKEIAAVLARPLDPGAVSSPAAQGIQDKVAQAGAKAKFAANAKEAEAAGREAEQREKDIEQRKRIIEIEKKHAEERGKLLLQQAKAAKDEIAAAEDAQRKVAAEVEVATAPTVKAQRAAAAATQAVANANNRQADAAEALTGAQLEAQARIDAAAAQLAVNNSPVGPERGAAKRALTVALAKLEAAKVLAAQEELAAIPKKRDASDALIKSQTEAAERLAAAHENLAMIEGQLAADMKKKLDAERPDIGLGIGPAGPPVPPGFKVNLPAKTLAERFDEQEAEKRRKAAIDQLKAEMAERSAAVRQAIADLNNPARRRLNPNIPTQKEVNRKADAIVQRNQEMREQMQLQQRIMQNQQIDRDQYEGMTAEEIRSAKKQAAEDARRSRNQMIEQINLARTSNRALQNIGVA